MTTFSDEAVLDLDLRNRGAFNLNEIALRSAEFGISEEVANEAVRFADSFPAMEAVERIEQAFVARRDRVSKNALKAVVRAICSGQSSANTPSLHVYRRDGSIVAWNTSKIEVAVRMAFLSCGIASAPAVEVAKAVESAALASRRPVLGIEDVQDLVQEALMRLGHFKVATQYVLYRASRAELREQAPALPDGEDGFVLVRGESGGAALWDGAELRAMVGIASEGLDLGGLGPRELERELRRSMSSEMGRADLERLILMNARSLVERDADFAMFAGRMATMFIYRETLGWDPVIHGIDRVAEMHRAAFRSYIERGVAIDRLSKELLAFDLDRLAGYLDPSRDLAFDFLGVQTLYDRYLIVDKTTKAHRRLENLQFFWMRVAMGLAIRETSPREEFVKKVFDLYTTRRFCSSTPTLFNAGTPHSQLSSCYLYKVDDNIESIMIRGIAENAFLSKWAGGLGGSWTAVRGTGSYIKGTNGESQGIIPFLKLHNDQLVAVNQGGKRRGSGCAYLESWHNDIEDFLELRRNTGDERRRCHDMNTANWIPDLFMKRMEARESWTLFRASETPDLHDLYGKAFEDRYVAYEKMAEEGKMFGRKIPALDLWKQMLKMVFETGHPWITFKDPCNLRSPQDHAGVIHSSNLCTEITLNTSEDETAVCNLGSVVLDSHIRDDGSLDLELLADTVRTAVRALDNVIDINYYPTEAAKRSNMRHRPIGLGVMGLQKALHKKALAFASDEAVEFNDEFMEAIAYYAYLASSELAKDRGSYSSYKGSKWDRGLLPQDTIDILESERGVAIDVPRGGKLDWAPVRAHIVAHGMRNSNVIAIAPTATISNIMGTTPCIEPNYKNLYVKSNLGGNFTILVPELVRDLKDAGLWDKDTLNSLKVASGELSKVNGIPNAIKARHMTAFDIPYEFVIAAAARRQKWIDQAQSLNLFLPVPDLKTLSHMYRRAWHTGIKTTYYLRSLGASAIEGPSASVEKVLRGVVAAAPAADVPAREYTAEEKLACSLEAMRNGEACEACQ